jgi:Tfp pilus assembly protein PilF
MRTERRLQRVEGYLLLGMVRDAAQELDRIPEQESSTTVLRYRMEVLQALEKWSELERISATVVRAHPEDPGAWIIWAYAARRATSIAAAETILRQAELRHPKEATIQFNLGCYACVQGNLLAAWRRVKQATKLNPAFKEAAAKDPDLVALRDYTPPDA